MQITRISSGEAVKVVAVGEGQFSEAKSIDISPSSLTKSLSALANSDGGDLYIGVDDIRSGLKRFKRWRGFDNVEAANGHIQAFERLFPLGQDCVYEFLRCDDEPGLVLHLQVLKTKRIVRATNSIAYVRRGAQNLPASDPESLRRLEFAKGLTSFETETVNADVSVVTGSRPAGTFIKEVVPKTNPADWLRKQVLVFKDKPTVAGVLLFADEPQALLPKRCGINLYRYKTTAKQGFREALAFDPITIEGWVYKQIRDAVKATTKEVEKIP